MYGLRIIYLKSSNRKWVHVTKRWKPLDDWNQHIHVFIYIHIYIYIIYIYIYIYIYAGWSIWQIFKFEMGFIYPHVKRVLSPRWSACSWPCSLLCQGWIGAGPPTMQSSSVGGCQWQLVNLRHAAKSQMIPISCPFYAHVSIIPFRFFQFSVFVVTNNGGVMHASKSGMPESIWITEPIEISTLAFMGKA